MLNMYRQGTRYRQSRRSSIGGDSEDEGFFVDSEKEDEGSWIEPISRKGKRTRRYHKVFFVCLCLELLFILYLQGTHYCQPRIEGDSEDEGFSVDSEKDGSGEDNRHKRFPSRNQKHSAYHHNHFKAS